MHLEEICMVRERVTGIQMYNYELPFISSVGHVISKSWILLHEE